MKQIMALIFAVMVAVCLIPLQAEAGRQNGGNGGGHQAFAPQQQRGDGLRQGGQQFGRQQGLRQGGLRQNGGQAYQPRSQSPRQPFMGQQRGNGLRQNGGQPGFRQAQPRPGSNPRMNDTRGARQGGVVPSKFSADASAKNKTSQSTQVGQQTDVWSNNQQKQTQVAKGGSVKDSGNSRNDIQVSVNNIIKGGGQRCRDRGAFNDFAQGCGIGAGEQIVAILFQGIQPMGVMCQSGYAYGPYGPIQQPYQYEQMPYCPPPAPPAYATPPAPAPYEAPPVAAAPPAPAPVPESKVYNITENHYHYDKEKVVEKKVVVKKEKAKEPCKKEVKAKAESKIGDIKQEQKVLVIVPGAKGEGGKNEVTITPPPSSSQPSERAQNPKSEPPASQQSSPKQWSPQVVPCSSEF